MAEKVVYENSICRMFPGWKTKIEGCVSLCSKRFVVNLECINPCNKSRVTIPLHISVWFESGCIVRNTLTQCAWGQEEMCGGMPIVKGQSFSIELECKPQVFSIIINGCHFSEYKHRLCHETINHIQVTGDVDVCDVIYSGIPKQASSDN